MDVKKGGVKEGANGIHGVEICEMQKDEILNVSRGVGPVSHVVLETLDFVMVSFANGRRSCCFDLLKWSI